MGLEPKTVCVDFDKTLCDSDYPKLGPPITGGREALQTFRDLGYLIIISSCRSCGWNWDLYYKDAPFVPAHEREVHQSMIGWLNRYDIPYDVIDDGTKGKVSADIYIDDKGFRFENWADAVAFVKAREAK